MQIEITQDRKWFREPIFLLLMAIGTAMSALLFIRTPNFGGDSIMFLVPWQNLIEGKGYTVNGAVETLWSPGYGMLAMLPYILIGDLEYAGMLVSWVSYLIILASSYYVARSYFGRKAAFWAGFITLFYPPLIVFSSSTLADVTYASFMFMSFVTFLRTLEEPERLIWYSLLGVISAVGSLVRPDLSIIVIWIGLYYAVLIAKGWKESGKPSGRRTFGLALICVTYFLVVLPYCLFLYHYSGHFTISNEFALAAEGGAEVATTWTLDDAKEPIVYIISNLESTLLFMKKNIMFYIAESMSVFFYFAFPMILCWLAYPFVCVKRISAYMPLGIIKSHFVPLAIYVTPLLPLMIFDVGERYTMPYSIILFPYIACLLAAILQGIGDGLRINYLKTTSVVCVVSFATFFLPVPYYFGHFHWNAIKTLSARSAHEGHRALGNWLASAGVDVDNLSLISPDKANVVLFYANKKHEPRGKAYSFRYAKSIEEVIEYMKDNKIRYMFLERYYSPENPIAGPIWKDPKVAEKYGFRLIKEEKGMFQYFELLDVNRSPR